MHTCRSLLANHFEDRIENIPDGASLQNDSLIKFLPSKSNNIILPIDIRIYIMYLKSKHLEFIGHLVYTPSTIQTNVYV